MQYCLITFCSGKVGYSDDGDEGKYGKGGKCAHWLALFCIRRNGIGQVQRRPHCPTPQKAITGNMHPTAEANRLDRERRGTGASGLLLYPTGNYGPHRGAHSSGLHAIRLFETDYDGSFTLWVTTTSGCTQKVLL